MGWEPTRLLLEEPQTQLQREEGEPGRLGRAGEGGRRGTALIVTRREAGGGGHPQNQEQKRRKGMAQPSRRKAGGATGVCICKRGRAEPARSRRGERRYDVPEQKYITAGTKREIKSAYKDTRGAARGKTCCFSNGTTANESHFTIIFCPGLVPAGF